MYTPWHLVDHDITTAGCWYKFFPVALVFVFLLFIFPLMLLLPLLTKIKRKYFMLYSLGAWPFARKYEEELNAYYHTGEEKPDASGMSI